jgi:hypothetical protein
MVRKLGERRIFTAQSFKDRPTVVGDQFENAYDVTKGVKHFVSDSETAWTSETLLDDKPPCQCVVTRQLKEVWGLLGLRVFLRRARPLFLCWCYQRFEFLQGRGGTGKAMFGREGTELLQPIVKTVWEVRLEF